MNQMISPQDNGIETLPGVRQFHDSVEYRVCRRSSQLVPYTPELDKPDPRMEWIEVPSQGRRGTTYRTLKFYHPEIA